MFGIGSTEILIICVVALLVIGPQKLPGFLRTLGKGMAEFKRMSSDVKSTLDHEIQRADMEERQKETKKANKKAQMQAQKTGAESVENSADKKESTAEIAPEKTEAETVATASAEPESSGDKA